VAAVRRAMWIERALSAVTRSKTEVAYRAALMDAYAEHLGVLEMVLIGAAEQNTSAAANETTMTEQ
jgi:hypothetical protein